MPEERVFAVRFRWRDGSRDMLSVSLSWRYDNNTLTTETPAERDGGHVRVYFWRNFGGVLITRAAVERDDLTVTWALGYHALSDRVVAITGEANQVDMQDREIAVKTQQWFATTTDKSGEAGRRADDDMVGGNAAGDDSPHANQRMFADLKVATDDSAGTDAGALMDARGANAAVGTNRGAGAGITQVGEGNRRRNENACVYSNAGTYMAMGANLDPVGNPYRPGDGAILGNDAIAADVRGRLNMDAAGDYGAGADNGARLNRRGRMYR